MDLYPEMQLHTSTRMNKVSTAVIAENTLGQSLLTFGPEFHMYTCMHAFATLTASHHMVKVKVHDVTPKHCALY